MKLSKNKINGLVVGITASLLGGGYIVKQNQEESKKFTRQTIEKMSDIYYTIISCNEAEEYIMILFLESL